MSDFGDLLGNHLTPLITDMLLACRSNGVTTGYETIADIIGMVDFSVLEDELTALTVSHEALEAEFDDHVENHPSGSGGGGYDYVCVADIKAQSTSGGAFVSGAYRVRDLNTIVSDLSSLCSLSSNQLTLPAGSYPAFRVRCPAYGVGLHSAWLYDVTHDVVLGYSHAGSSYLSGSAYSPSIAFGAFVLSESTVLEVRHQCATTRNADGFGIGNPYQSSAFSVAEFWKVST